MLEIFFFSFLVALTGALSPGPVLTFTVYKSLQGKKGYLAGLFVSLGHASLELVLLTIILLGGNIFFRNILLLIVIGIVGGILLIITGAIMNWKKLDEGFKLLISGVLFFLVIWLSFKYKKFKKTKK